MQRKKRQQERLHRLDKLEQSGKGRQPRKLLVTYSDDSQEKIEERRLEAGLLPGEKPDHHVHFRVVKARCDEYTNQGDMNENLN